jgi:hypothetical protein
MKKLIYFILITVFAVNSYADSCISFTEHTVSTDANGARAVFAIDLDDDEDIDLLSALRDDSKIAWYENDSSENFTEHEISTDADGAMEVFAIDVDQDGDIDILSASVDDDKIAWYENDGSENFTEHEISTDANGAYSVFAIDVDGDGDIDVLSASRYDNKIAWYENDGSENFTEHEISTDANDAKEVFAIDIDQDGDIDILSASNDDDKIAWYENDGSENFTEHEISTDANGARFVFAIDVDGDGDIDVLSASVYDDKVAWYENDGSESFTAHTITTSADYVVSIFAIDVDGDGDIDVLSASVYDDKVAWYENDGSENFTEHEISTDAFWAQSVYADDIDKDGDIDVISGSSNDDKIAWYEADHSGCFISPDLVLPTDEATEQETSLTFDWEDVDSADTYHLQVSEDSGFGTLTIDADGLTASEYDASGLDYSTTYYWRVRSINDDETSDWSEVWSFETEEDICSEEPTDTDGDGYRNISTLCHLRWISENDSSWTWNFELDNDINAADTRNWNIGDHDNDPATPDSAMGWSPIGNNTTKFTGKFDANEYVIDSLYINRPEQNYVGFFGHTNGAEITNINFSNNVFIGFDRVGGIIGQSSDSTIVENSYSSGNISGRNYIGGLVGLNYTSSVINSKSICDVIGNSEVGGLIGWNLSYSTVRYCYSAGSIIGEDYVGGLVGKNSSNLSNSYSTGSVTGVDWVGGLVGINLSNVNDCYSTGSVTGNYAIGGLVGYNSHNTSLVNSSYSIGSVTGNSEVGGLIGRNFSTVSYSFWDTETSGQDESSGGTGRTTFQMKRDTTFTNAGWDFDSTWAISSQVNDGYPYLQGFGMGNDICSEEPTDTDGDGYRNISTLCHLRWISENDSSWTWNFELDNDINAADTRNWNDGLGWSPIGEAYKKFEGIFNGNGFEIDSIFINREDSQHIGFFGYTEDGSCIKDISLSNCEVYADDESGVLVGYSNSMINNCNVHDASLNGVDRCGGLVGLNHGPIVSCNSNVTISGANSIGGLVGSNGSSIYNSYSNGTVSGFDNVGGLVGSNGANIVNCYSTCEVEADTDIGGLIGYNNGSIINSYSTGEVTGVTNYGGLVGYNNNGNAINCFWDTETSSQDESACGTGKSTDEMHAESTFTNAYWNFDYIWNIDSGYPFIEVNEDYRLEDTDNNGKINISSLDDLKWLMESGMDLDLDYELENNIDASDTENWFIGDHDGNTNTPDSAVGFIPIPYFNGSFDGKNNIISNLFINNHSLNDVSLFSSLYKNGEVMNLIIEDCNIVGFNNVSSLVANNYGKIYNCKSNGELFGDTYVSGLVSINKDDGIIEKCMSNSNIEGDGCVSGLVSINHHLIKLCYSEGNVNCSNLYSGGLLSINHGQIDDSYSKVNVSGNKFVGGLIGRNNSSFVFRTYSTGEVSGNTDVGGLVGYGSNLLSNSFWDTETSGQDDSDGGTGKTTSEMKTESTFTDAGWDFDSTWSISSQINDGYPYLQGFGMEEPGNYAFYFDGVGDLVKTGLYAGYFNYPIATWEAIVKPQLLNGSEDYILSVGNGFFDRGLLLADNKFAANDGYNNWKVQYADTSKWYHIAVSYAQDSVYLYINGKRYSKTLSNNQNSTWLAIGCNPPNEMNFKGYIDEVRIWKDIRTQQEILDNMNRELESTSDTNLVAYYNFNNFSADSLFDEKGMYNGTIIGDVEPFALEIDTLLINPSQPQYPAIDEVTGLTSEFEWLSISYADAYAIEISSDYTFSSYIVRDTTLESASYQIGAGDLSSNSRYFWRVSLKIGDAFYPWSDAWSFETGEETTDTNLIKNPSCELPLVDGEIPYWDEVIATTWTRGTEVTAYDGDYHFYAGVNSYAELEQYVDVSDYQDEIDEEVMKFEFSAMMRSYSQSPRDLPKVILEFWNSDKSTRLDTIDFGFYNEIVWTKLLHTMYLPVNTRWVNVRLISDRNSGLQNDGYFDDLMLKVTDSQSKLLTATCFLDGLWDGTTHSPAPVSVELRSGDDLISSTLESRKSGLIQSDGTVEVDFGDVADDDYWIVVRSAGYLPLGSTSEISLSSSGESYDFTDAESSSAGGARAVYEDDGDYICRTGDLNYDRKTNASDAFKFIANNGKSLTSYVPDAANYTESDPSTTKELKVTVYLDGLWDGTTHAYAPVSVELYSGTDLMSGTFEAGRTGLLNSSGEVTVNFGDLSDGDYWVVVRSAGYLPLGSTSEILLSSTLSTYDFTDAESKSAGGARAVIEQDGDYLMRTGDMNFDMKTNASDAFKFINNNGKSVSSYVPAP